MAKKPEPRTKNRSATPACPARKFPLVKITTSKGKVVYMATQAAPEE